VRRCRTCAQSPNRYEEVAVRLLALCLCAQSPIGDVDECAVPVPVVGGCTEVRVRTVRMHVHTMCRQSLVVMLLLVQVAFAALFPNGNRGSMSITGVTTKRTVQSPIRFEDVAVWLPERDVARVSEV
jgi:hypothetical protein